MSAGAGELVLMLAALGAGATVLMGSARWRRRAGIAALVLAIALIAVVNWDSQRLTDLRDDPAALAALLALAVLVVGAGAAAFRRWPIAFPLAAIAVLAVRVPVGIGGDTSHLLAPLYLVIAGGIAAGRPDLGRLRLVGHWRWVGWALAATLILYGIQAAYGPGFSQAAENAGFFFVPFAVLFAQLGSVRWDRRLLVAALLVVGAEGLIFTAVAAGQYAAGELWWNQKVIEGNQYHDWFRANSLFWDPNIFGRYLAVAISLAAASIAWATARRRAWLVSIAALVMMAGLVASFSQSALLALLAGLAVILILRWGLRRTAFTIAALLAIGIAALAISGVPDLSEERVEDETSGRVSLIRGGLELAEDEPIVGHGSGSFAPEYRKAYDSSPRIAVSSHTEPVTIAAEQGAVGMVVYLALLAAAAVAFVTTLPARLRGRELRWARVGIGAAFAGFAVMVAHSVAYAAFLTDPITWALLAAGVALSNQHPPIAPPSAPQYAIEAEGQADV